MTERQALGFARAIEKRRMTERYTEFKFHASLHRNATQLQSFPSLQEFLGVESEDEDDAAFDAQADKKFEEYALKQLAQMKKASGG